MARILVTGGTGTLGRHVVAGLLAEGHDVAVLSRRPRTTAGATATARLEPIEGVPAAAGDWFVGDLRSGTGIAKALDGADTVVHLATGRGDNHATGHLISAAAATGLRPHLVSISIVGARRIPLTYYRHKSHAERMIIASGMPWTILRTTQFHALVARGLRTLATSPVMPVPAGVKLQPIAETEVAARLIELANSEPAQRVDPMGGPEIRNLTDLAGAYCHLTGRKRIIVPTPVPGKIGRGFRAGYQLTPEFAVGGQTFADYLSRGPVPVPERAPSYR